MTVLEFKSKNTNVHRVENEWHYPIMIKYGFQPLETQAIGLVRSYGYLHENGRRVRVVDGNHATYWIDDQQNQGFWSSLEPQLRALTK